MEKYGIQSQSLSERAESRASQQRMHARRSVFPRVSENCGTRAANLIEERGDLLHREGNSEAGKSEGGHGSEIVGLVAVAYSLVN